MELKYKVWCEYELNGVTLKEMVGTGGLDSSR